MLDLNSDDDRLRSLSPNQSLSSLGQVLEDEVTYAVEVDGGGGAATTSYDQSGSPTGLVLADQGAASLPANAVQAVQTLDLPKFDFSTGVASCTMCASEGATTNALATNVVPAKVTPLPEAPQTTNWLLWAVGLGVAFYAFKGPAAGLGCLDDTPAPAPVLNGTPPPRRPEPKKLKHVATLKIS